MKNDQKTSLISTAILLYKTDPYVYYIMTDYYPKQSPYGISTAGTKYKDERYTRHADWIEPLVSLFTSRLSRGHNRVCADCGGKMNLTANIIRRHLASEKHLRAVDKWTEQDETEMLDYKKTCQPKGNKTKTP